jgi:hypothetical protein
MVTNAYTTTEPIPNTNTRLQKTTYTGINAKDIAINGINITATKRGIEGQTIAI